MSDPVTSSLETHSVARKTLQGAFSLGIRQLFVQGARVVAGILLARLLTPAEFGIYAIVLYIQTFLLAFGDAGLAGSLVRQHDEPDIEDYRVVFTFQQLLVLLLSALIWIASPWIARRYNLTDASVFRLIALSFFITSFMTVPQIMLDRRLDFQKIAVIDTVQALVFNGSCVLLAWKGVGVSSFGWALLLRATSGAILAYWFKPWSLRWSWNWQLIRSHMRFGIPYQGIQVTSLLKDSITPILIGFLLGTAEVGYISLAIMVAAYPVLALMVLQRIYMPAFARLQKHKEQLKTLSEKIIWATNMIAAPLSILTLVLISEIIKTVYGSKWLVTLPYFYLFWLANLFVPTATPALSLLSAMGKSKTALNFSLIWMGGTWLIGAPLILVLGGIGFAIANLLVTLTNIWLYRSAQKCVDFRIIPVIGPVWCLGLVSGLAVFLLRLFYRPNSLPLLALYSGVGLAIYGIGLYLFFNQTMRGVLRALGKTS